MNVKQLKQLLEQFDENTEIMFNHTDHTDFNYKINMSESDIYLDSPTSDHSDLPDEMYDENYDYIGPQVLIFDMCLEND